MYLDDFVGSENTVSTLKNYIASNRVPSCIILKGEDNSGKATLSKLFISDLVTKLDDDSAGKQVDKILKEIHPDIIFVRPKNKSIVINQIREVISDSYTRPNEADVKVYIIDEFEQITLSAQNALLKILEEPPKNVFFIITCNSSVALLPTITSRAAVLSVSGLSIGDCIKIVSKELPEVAADNIADMSRFFLGSPGKTIRYFTDDDYRSDVDLSLEILSCLAEKQPFNVLQSTLSLLKSKDNFRSVVNLLKAQLSFLLRVAEPGDNVHYSGNLVLQKLSYADIMKCTEILGQSTVYIDSNVNTSIGVNFLCAKLVSSIL